MHDPETDGMDAGEWARSFHGRFVDGLDPDVELCVADCHI